MKNWTLKINIFSWLILSLGVLVILLSISSVDIKAITAGLLIIFCGIGLLQRRAFIRKCVIAVSFIVFVISLWGTFLIVGIATLNFWGVQSGGAYDYMVKQSSCTYFPFGGILSNILWVFIFIFLRIKDVQNEFVVERKNNSIPSNAGQQKKDNLVIILGAFFIGTFLSVLGIVFYEHWQRPSLVSQKQNEEEIRPIPITQPNVSDIKELPDAQSQVQQTVFNESPNKENDQELERNKEFGDELNNQITFPLAMSDKPVRAVYYNGNISIDSLDKFSSTNSNWKPIRIDFISPTCVRYIYNTGLGDGNMYCLYFVNRNLRLASLYRKGDDWPSSNQQDVQMLSNVDPSLFQEAQMDKQRKFEMYKAVMAQNNVSYNQVSEGKSLVDIYLENEKTQQEQKYRNNMIDIQKQQLEIMRNQGNNSYNTNCYVNGSNINCTSR